MRDFQTTSMKEEFFSSAGQVLDGGMFWRGSLARAVKRRDFRGTLWAVFGLSLLLFFYVWQHMQVVKLSYEVQGLKTEKQQLTNEYYYLKYKMYDVNSLPRLEREAREQLGMVTPRSDQVVILDESMDLYPKWFTFWTNAMKRTDHK